MKKLKVAVLCGGYSNEREVSLRSGKEIIKSLSSKKYIGTLVDFKPNRPINIKSLSRYDVVLIALHGKFGEDGTIQGLLELAHIPYTGSGVLASAIGMNKEVASKLLNSAGMYTPASIAVHKKSKVLLDDITYPSVIKPNASGSSVGVTIVQNKQSLRKALKMAWCEDDVALVQEYIKGREITCGVLGNTNQTKLTTLPVVEIVSGTEFFDYDAKYNSRLTQEICPARLDKQITKLIQKTAERAHSILGCDGLTRSDFMLSSTGKLYFLEINTIPGMTSTSLCPKEAKAAGISFEKFLGKIIELAIKKHKKRPRA